MTILRCVFLLWCMCLSLRIFSACVLDTAAYNYLGLVGGQALYFAVAGQLYVALAVSVLYMAFEHEEDGLNRRIAEQTTALHKAKETAEAALVAKSRFLSATGHDLRQAVHALSLLLTSVTCELSTNEQAKSSLMSLTCDMTGVMSSMTEQLNALLDMAHLESGSIVPKMADCCLAGIFGRLKSQFEPEAAATDIDLRFVDTSEVARTDESLLFRIVGNLIANAIKFRRGGRVVIGCRRRHGCVELQVCDDGIGIPTAHLGIIFDEYSQVDANIRTRHKGLGLGLFIARNMAQLMGHSISVKSLAGRGSMFIVRL